MMWLQMSMTIPYSPQTAYPGNMVSVGETKCEAVYGLLFGFNDNHKDNKTICS